MKSIVSQFMLQLSHEEKLELLADLKAAIADEIAGFPEEPDGYPRCGCPAFVKKGRDADGAQRRACKGCGRTFPAKSGSLLANSELGPSVWMAFAECMADALSLRESAERCGVSLYTSWFMRMRVCEVMRSLCPRAQARSMSTARWSGTTCRETSRARASSSCAPRQLPGRDGRKGAKGRSKERIVVECGVNKYGDCFCDAIDRGSAGAGALARDLSARIPEGSAVVSDGHPSYGFAASAWEHRVVDPKDPSTGNINMVNALHSRLREFLAPFHGWPPATCSATWTGSATSSSSSAGTWIAGSCSSSARPRGRTDDAGA
ncbi:MAG: hypothetical protein V8R48_02725 [Eggerthella lenta]